MNGACARQKAEFAFIEAVTTGEQRQCLSPLELSRLIWPVCISDYARFVGVLWSNVERGLAHTRHQTQGA